jgi:four helix bundle protein
VGANYRAACRAQSRADFIAKLKIVEEECDEALDWLDVFVAANMVPTPHIVSLVQKGKELLRIVVASIQTARRTQ